jgi:anti-anti-sigma regulatory factor
MGLPHAPDPLQPGDHVCFLADGPTARLAAEAHRAATAAHQRAVTLTGVAGAAELAGLVGLARGAVRDGYQGLRVIADLGGADGAERLAVAEAHLNRLVLDHPVTAVCLYDGAALDRDTRWRLTASHHGTRSATGGWSARLHVRRLTGGRGLRLAGEVDVTNRDALHAALAALLDTPQGTGPLVLDAAGLVFTDAGAANLLLRAGRAATGGLTVTGAGPIVARVLDHLGAADVPGLTVLPAPGFPTPRTGNRQESRELRT